MRRSHHSPHMFPPLSAHVPTTQDVMSLTLVDLRKKRVNGTVRSTYIPFANASRRLKVIIKMQLKKKSLDIFSLS